MVPNYAKWWQMGPSHAKWVQIMPNSAKRGQIMPPNEAKFLPNVAKHYQMPNGSKPCQLGPIIPNHAIIYIWCHSMPNHANLCQTMPNMPNKPIYVKP